MKTRLALFMVCFLFTGCGQPYHSSIQTPKQPFPQNRVNISDHPHQKWKLSFAPASEPRSTQTPIPTVSPAPVKRILSKNQASSIKKKKEPSLPVQRNQQKKLTLVQLRSKYPQFFRLNGSARENKIALTFDDGPDNKYTPQILDILHKNHVRATFFLVGIRAKTHPAIVKRIIHEGHAIGNHSYNHPNPAKLTEAQFEKQFVDTQAILRRIAGYEPRLIRTPYGAIQENQLRWAAKHGFIVVNWDIDTLDWKQLNSSQVLANTLSHTHRGAIILQHSAGGPTQDLSGTVKALPILIAELKRQGFEMVTVPQLLHIRATK
jgi:peptidoglycan/xylan/chitin deacetylase (PgdA/CDA1 family)